MKMQKARIEPTPPRILDLVDGLNETTRQFVVDDGRVRRENRKEDMPCIEAIFRCRVLFNERV